MATWPNISDHQIYLGYFPGSGGSRFRRLLMGYQWNQLPGEHLHSYEKNMHKWTIDDGVPKCPEPWYIDWDNNRARLSPAFENSHYQLLTSHCMHVPTIKQIFPGKIVVKIYSDLKLSLRRWWTIFGKQWYHQQKIQSVLLLNLSHSPMSPIESVIKSHLDYYSRLMDVEHEYPVYVIPGESEFSDFVLQEFNDIRSSADAKEFDQAWDQIRQDPRWEPLMLNPLLRDPEFCRNRREYLDSVAKTS